MKKPYVMSPDKPNKGGGTKNTLPNGGGNTNQKKPPYVLLGIAVGFVVLVFVLAFFKGRSQNAPPQPTTKEVSTTEKVGDDGFNSEGNGEAQGKPIQAQQNPQGNNASEPNQVSPPSNEFAINQTPDGESVSSPQEIKFFVDTTTGKRYIVTETGNIPVDSQQGQEIIAQHQAELAKSQAAQVQGGTTPPVQAVATSVSKEQFEQSQRDSQEQIKALDEKINNLYSEVITLRKQNGMQKEALQKVASKVIEIQPIVKSQNDLAKTWFGKNGDKVLASRNQEIEAASVIGNKAYLMDTQNNYYLVEVGDVIKGTSLKVKAINPVTNTVLVAH